MKGGPRGRVLPGPISGHHLDDVGSPTLLGSKTRMAGTRTVNLLEAEFPGLEVFIKSSRTDG